jgi:hypothetical protein
VLVRGVSVEICESFVEERNSGTGLISITLLYGGSGSLEMRVAAFEELQKVGHSFAGFCGFVKFDGGREIGFRDYGYIRTVEDCRVLQGFVFTLGDRKENEAQIFTEIVGNGTHEIADIFNEEESQRVEIPAFDSWTMTASRWHIVPVRICFTGA